MKAVKVKLPYTKLYKNRKEVRYSIVEIIEKLKGLLKKIIGRKSKKINLNHVIVRVHPVVQKNALGAGEYRKTPKQAKEEIRTSRSFSTISQREKTCDESRNVELEGIEKRSTKFMFDTNILNKILGEKLEIPEGSEYVPSYLLPGLQPMKLVSKTSSNKYSGLAMSPEIITVVREELEKFKHPLQRTKRVSFTNRSLRMQQEISAMVDEIVELRRHINLVFEHKFKMKLFKENEKAICDIRKPCSNEEDFNNRIMSLALLIDQIEIDQLKKKVRGSYEPGSINLLEEFLKENFPDYNKVIIQNFREIIALRSKKYPIHSDDKEFIDAMKYFGITKFPPDWEDLWERALKGYLQSLRELLKTIQ